MPGARDAELMILALFIPLLCREKRVTIVPCRRVGQQVLGDFLGSRFWFCQRAPTKARRSLNYRFSGKLAALRV